MNTKFKCTRESCHNNIITFILFKCIVVQVWVNGSHNREGILVYFSLCMFSPPPTFHTDSTTAHAGKHPLQMQNKKGTRSIFHLSNNWISSIPSSVGLKPQSRQMDVTQRFMSSSDSATKYQILSSVLRSKTKLLSSSFFVKERPASTWRRGRNGADLLLSNSQATLRIY